jgi:hypothetical protein
VSAIPIPLPAEEPGPGDEVRYQPYYVREVQDWAVQQEHLRHSQALYDFGEWAMFCLLWHIQDYSAGLVGRCSRCYGADGSKQREISDVYQQPTQNRCPVCFGTTFEGGFKALIIRPTLFSDTDESERMQARGVVHPSDLDVESTPDFRVRSGDYVFRSSGDRFQLRVPQRVTLRTGFAHPHQSTAAIGYNHARASLEDPNVSVAYLIPPPAATLPSLLSLAGKTPADFTQYEIIRSSLIPVGDD